MKPRKSAGYLLAALGFSTVTGCEDLRLADQLDTGITQPRGGTATASNPGGSTAFAGQGGTTQSAQHSTIAGANTGGVDASSGGTTQDAQHSTIAGTNTGGVDASSGGSTNSTGGTTQDAQHSTIAGTNTGGVDASSGGTTNSTGGSTSSIGVCPEPISKPDALLAAEPTPVDTCARVSNVAQISLTQSVYGFTNGEIYIYSPSSGSLPTRLDTWTMTGPLQTLPRAIVTSIVTPVLPRHNNEGALQIGYADPRGTSPNPWWTGAMGHGWFEATVEQPGTAMTITACPFHVGHLELATPWITQGSLTSSTSYTATDSRKLNQHLQLAKENFITAIETVTKADGWLVYVGTEFGQIYVSNLLPENVTWNDATHSLNTVVTWTRITDALMPKRWITRLTVHPTHPERIFAVFYSNDGDAVWYSADSGQTWSNRQANLPRLSNPVNHAPPVLGVSFNPFLDGAAYAVTSLTSYYSVDYGLNWSEW